MIIRVGSINRTKFQAVDGLFRDSGLFGSDLEVVGVDVKPGISRQPLSLEETLLGARNRAVLAYDKSDYGVGIEDGLMHFPQIRTGYLNVCVAVIYDGTKSYEGLSPGFQIPRPVLGLIKDKALTLSEAFREAGLTNIDNIGAEKGVIYPLSGQTIDRGTYTKLALMMALVDLNNYILERKLSGQ